LPKVYGAGSHECALVDVGGGARTGDVTLSVTSIDAHLSVEVRVVAGDAGARNAGHDAAGTRDAKRGAGVEVEHSGNLPVD